MSTNLKNRLAEVIGQYLKDKNKFVVFVFLVVLVIFLAGYLRPDKLTASVLDIIKNKKITEIAQEEEIMGGPIMGDDSSFSAQAAVDLSADDELENMDYTLIQDNSIVASANPSLLNQFSSFKKDIIYYIVQKSDTPEQIAVSHNINTDTLLWANNLNSRSVIRPGDKLIILPINGIRAQIKKGDTIEGLAKKYKADAEEISQFNLFASNKDLKVGEYAIIPDGEMPVIISKPAISAPKFASTALTGSGWLIQPAVGRNWGRLHSNNGIDIANPCGTPIYAAAAGTVALVDVVGWNGGYGKNVRIQHSNGALTLYAHLSQAVVESGQAVAQGQLIGLMGTTGRSTGCHIHFEVRGAKNPFARK